jgi:ATP/maltotriose-dependent transcriptional regulator MalT
MADVAAGWELLASGRWVAALEQFDGAGDDPTAWEGIGVAKWWLDDADATIAARETAHRLYRSTGDDVGAARVAAELAWDAILFGPRTAVAHAWLDRAEALLQGKEPCAEHAWLAVRRAEVALHEGDAERALAAARSALAAGRLVGREDVQVAARSVEGLALVQSGDVADGMRRLDASALAATAGDVDDLMWIGKVCCNLITACERVGDAERATQWCDEVKEFAQRWELRTLFNVCRTQYASVLLLQGEWGAAEEELSAALEVFAGGRRAALHEGTARLGELRRRQGRRKEAQALFAAAELHGVARRGVVELALDEGDGEAALALARRLVRAVRPHAYLARLDALALLARAALAAGDRDAAAEAAGAAREAAEAIGTDLARATASFVGGLVADDPQLLEDAVDEYGLVHAPYERARARTALAQSLRGHGQVDRARREDELARASLIELGALPAGHDGGPLTRRELEVAALIAAGRSNREIADVLVVSEHTVHRHVANILRKLGEPTRAAVAARVSRDGLV